MLKFVVEESGSQAGSSLIFLNYQMIAWLHKIDDHMLVVWLDKRWEFLIVSYVVDSESPL